MTKRSVIIVFVASLLLVSTYFLPLWRITLEAPQYPGGLQLDIYINKIGGQDENILQNINILNHYIGMKKIIPEAIPELKILPIVVAFFIALGIATALIKKKFLLLVWLGLFIVFGVLSMYDFYLWEYDYGHNLDPTAPIKVPGMVYQPPLFGSKMLLNFKATSLPASGAIMMIISFFSIMYATVNDYIIVKRK